MDSKDIEHLYKEAKARGEIITLVAELEKENKELKEHKENLIRADKKKTEHIEELEKENKELKEYWSIEIKTCNRYREKCDELEKENRTLKKEFEQYKQNYNIERDRQTIFLMTGKRY